MRRENLSALIRDVLQQRYPDKLVPTGIPGEVAEEVGVSRHLVATVIRETGWRLARETQSIHRENVSELVRQLLLRRYPCGSVPARRCSSNRPRDGRQLATRLRGDAAGRLDCGTQTPVMRGGSRSAHGRSTRVSGDGRGRKATEETGLQAERLTRDEQWSQAS